uniref:Protein expanded n=1 Tax=Cacopsylla melanoneura TaxID=428564 RepID=A0A8D8TMN3_9HEMI
MRNCPVSAPVQCCNAAELSAPGLRFVAVHLLTKQVLYFVVEPKARTKELLQRTCQHLSSQGMLGADLFGLATDLDGEYIFVDPEYKINKYAPKNWRASSTHGLDSAGKPLLNFYFRVHFYVETPFILRDEISLHHYYLQLRQNLISRGCLFDFSFKEELLYLLVGLALQADLGDFSETQHTGTYFPLHEYFPPQMISAEAEAKITKSAANLHRANRSLSRNKAETQFIREASCNDFSPLSHNSHLYHLKHKKQETCPGSVWLTICHRGIEIYDRNKHHGGVATDKFQWNDIGRLTFDRKKFEVRAVNGSGRSNEKLTYFCSSDEKSKHLLLLCRATHQFSFTLQPKLNQLLRTTNTRDCPRWTADGCYSSNRVDQRISVISSTSSNTTSGIVSDRVHSHDESEDELEDLEIMIIHPPAPSVESLALAHLRDSSSPLTLSEEEVGECNLSKQSVPVGVTEGSQCSSSCSTVVQQINVTPTPSPPKEHIHHHHHHVHNAVPATTNTTPSPGHISSSHIPRRCGSTTSSLELGYSHTAQNSALSDIASCCMSAANTTVAVSTVAASSETSGVFTGTTGTQDSEGQRSRSGSIVSASGSFHGDGSDPSDAGRGNLLSAEELSDLIVGRKPSLVAPESPSTPRRGVYPTRATVSSTLDSDSDYVTLPPPPIPPPRTDSVEKSSAKDLDSNVDSLLDSSRMLGSLSNLSFSSSSKKSLQEESSMHRSSLLYNPPFLSATRHALLSKSTSSLNSCTTSKSFLTPSYVIHPEHQYYTLSNYHPYVSYASAIPEEANACFVTTKPHINFFTTHTNVTPSFPQSAAPIRSIITEARQGIRLDPSARMKLQPPGGLIPIVGSNNYLDVRSSAAAYLSHIHQKFPPPPPVHRQPPPPPPPPRTMYSNSQIEQYKQGLYSDGDYVYYPLQDPAISKQEYMESKLALQYPPPPYKSRLLYRSTPNVAIASGYIPVSFSAQGHKYSSNQNLTDTPLSFLSSSSQLYSPLSYASSSSSQMSLHQKYLPVGRTRSDDNILNTVYEKESPPPPVNRTRRPPPPPPYDLHTILMKESQNLAAETTLSRSHQATSSSKSTPPPMAKPTQPTMAKPTPSTSKHTRPLPTQPSSPMSSVKTDEVDAPRGREREAEGMLDIRSLREKSKNLDLPLISALCNDRSLIKQTNVCVSPTTTLTPADTATLTHTAKKKLFASFLSSGAGNMKNSSSCLASTKLKYPVSNPIFKSSRKSHSISSDTPDSKKLSS